MTSPPLKFPDTFVARAKDKSNPQGRRLTIREIASLTGNVYEHIRKIWRGDPVLSEELNAKLCQLLGIPEVRMWEVIRRHKAKRRYPDLISTEPRQTSGAPLRQVDATPGSGAAHTGVRSAGFVVRHFGVSLVLTDRFEEAVKMTLRHHPEGAHVESCTPVALDAAGKPLCSPEPAHDEVIDGTVANPPVLVPLDHWEARLVRASLLCADDKVGRNHLVEFAHYEERKWRDLLNRLDNVIYATDHERHR